jgi:hypothetical protein
MTFEISFPGQPAAEAGVLAQELRLALLRSGVDPTNVEIVRERPDTMDLGSCVQLYFAIGKALEPLVPALTALELAKLLCEICVPAHSGIRVKTARNTREVGASEMTPERLKQIIDAASNDEHGD